MVILNNVAGYLLLTVGLGCYLSIVLVEKDFIPSRFGLAINLCSGIIMVAVNQIGYATQLIKEDSKEKLHLREDKDQKSE